MQEGQSITYLMGSWDVSNWVLLLRLIPWISLLYGTEIKFT